MYILEFINSNTVYKHLIDIGYEPDALTAAFIAWQSKDHTHSRKKRKRLSGLSTICPICLFPHIKNTLRGQVCMSFFPNT